MNLLFLAFRQRFIFHANALLKQIKKAPSYSDGALTLLPLILKTNAKMKVLPKENSFRSQFVHKPKLSCGRIIIYYTHFALACQ